MDLVYLKTKSPWGNPQRYPSKNPYQKHLAASFFIFLNFIQFLLQHISAFGVYVLRFNVIFNTHEIFKSNLR